jgi:hypothetical protein
MNKIYVKCPKCDFLSPYNPASNETIVPDGTLNAVKRLIQCRNPNSCPQKLVIWVKYIPENGNNLLNDPTRNPNKYDPPRNPKKYDPPTFPGIGL